MLKINTLIISVVILSNSVYAKVDGVNEPKERGDLVYRQLTTGPDWFKDLGHVGIFEQQNLVLEVLNHPTSAIQLNTIQDFYDQPGLYLGAGYNQLAQREINVAIESGLDQMDFGAKYSYAFTYKLGEKKLVWELIDGKWSAIVKIFPGEFRCDTFMNYVHAEGFGVNGSYITPKRMFQMMPKKR